MKFKWLLVMCLLLSVTLFSSFTGGRSTGGAWISSGSHAGSEMTACDEHFYARDLYDDDTVLWYVNGSYAGSGRDIWLTVSEGDEIKIIVNADEPDYTYEYYDTIIACE